MATIGNVEATLSAIPDAALQRVLKLVFRYVLKDIRFGRATAPLSLTQAPSENHGGGFFTGTTSGTANREFAIAHSLGRIPYLCIPILPLDQKNAAVARLTVSQAADATNVYLKSPDTSQPIYLYIEG